MKKIATLTNDSSVAAAHVLLDFLKTNPKDERVVFGLKYLAECLRNSDEVIVEIL